MPSFTEFSIKSCSMIVQSAGRSAQSLKELRDGVETVPSHSLSYHFYGYLMRPRAEQLYHNDLSAWVGQSVGDQISAEKLDALNPSYFPTLEDLREAILDVLDEPVSSGSFLGWARGRSRFHFLMATILVFQTGLFAKDPLELAEKLSQCPPASAFYHFVDARLRTGCGDDFSLWLLSSGIPQEEVSGLMSIDPYLMSLQALKNRIVEELTLIGGRCRP
ncbi:MAG: DUF5752 family protein [Thermanaerothrix sp.]|nr:DUF5752 family protein [Thermanaerothrix sp.]